MEIVIVFIFGLLLGSFLNLLGSRLPKGEDVFISRSHCDYCKKVLRWYELIPIVSYLLQSGKCRRCHGSLSAEYPLAELVTAVGLVILTLQIGLTAFPLLVCTWFIFASLLVITVADFKYEIIPDSMVVTLLLASVGFHLFSQTLTYSNIVMGVGAGLFFLLLWIGTRGAGMGFGDVKLSAVLGFLFGYPLAIVALYVAFLTGALLGVILILTGKKGLKSHISFGPFLIFGALVASRWGYALLGIWQRIL